MPAAALDPDHAPSELEPDTCEVAPPPLAPPRPARVASGPRASPAHACARSEPPSFGRAAEWARDLALVGGVTATIAPLLTLDARHAVRFAPAAVIVAVATGLALGRVAPSLFSRHVRRLPIPLLLGAGFGLGAFWGAAAGLAGALASGLTPGYWTGVAGRCGAMVLGILWLPYLLAHVRGRATWPLVALACVLGPSAAALVRAIVS